MQVLVRPAAAADIDDAFLWYEQQRPRLGAEFLQTVDSALAAIQSNPQLSIVIVACMHGRRDPKRWQSRA